MAGGTAGGTGGEGAVADWRWAGVWGALKTRLECFASYGKLPNNVIRYCGNRGITCAFVKMFIS
jgi:hypothetical protein